MRNVVQEPPEGDRIEPVSASPLAGEFDVTMAG